jgi:uncharacterized protein YecT (DUF1311 family)
VHIYGAYLVVSSNKNMTRTILLISLLFQLLQSHGQTCQTSPKYNLDENCSEGGQQNMNYCFSKAVDTLKKIMNVKYTCITRFLDSKIKYYSKNDTSQVSDYKKMKRIIISSQKIWVKLQAENVSFYEGGGGTITPMLVAQSLIMDLKDRLRRLDEFIKEIGQGDDSAVLNCK